MLKVTRAEVMARITDALRQAPDGLVATDGDGTLWTGDVGDDVFHAMLARGTMTQVARDAVRAVGRNHGVPDDESASRDKVAIERVYDAYKRGAFDERTMYELQAIVFAGWQRADVDAFVMDVLAKEKLADRIHPELARLVAWLAGQDVKVVLVSASPRYVVERAATFAGIDPREVVAVTPFWDDDVMIPDVLRPIPYDDGKVSGLRAHAGAGTLVAAFGDNAFDFAMLSESRVPVAIRPKPRLAARAADLPRMVELEREDP
ncbi:MAG: haloacid dehalogenase-like hydrolase [Polyangiaceae bacterium]